MILKVLHGLFIKNILLSMLPFTARSSQRLFMGKRIDLMNNDVLSIASHELKTPLTALKLQVEMVKREMDNHPETPIPTHKMKSIINRTHQDVLRLARLVDDMLDSSRIGVGQFSLNLDYFNLQDFIDEFKVRVGTLNREIFFHSHCPGLVHWDKYRVEQVLLNLITNAIRYGENSPISVQVKIGGGHAYIEVKDLGPGIPKNIQKLIFRKYGRGLNPSNRSGLGLGLYIVQEIVRLHQGEIKVERKLGEGACFKIRLPIHAVYENTTSL